ncbi:MAG: hypothetical protein JEY71_12105 [Sphaerochaeta sp.]|nr:hypothetical protein [Sphaerochaeta sp.]
MGYQYISSAMPFDLNSCSTFDRASSARSFTSTSRNNGSRKIIMETISELLTDSFITQSNINELIWHGMQLVAETIEVEKLFSFNLEPPVFLNTAEEIRATKGDDLFNRIKTIVDDQESHRAEYFAPLKNIDC